MKKNITLMLFIILSLIVLNPLFGNKDEIRQLKIIREFPTEKEMNQYKFFLIQGVNFDILNDKLYFCTQFGNEIVVFDLDGDYVKSFGQLGQGPGDFSYPLKALQYKDDLYIGDNANARIQILTEEGKFKYQIKIINMILDFVVVNNKIFIFSPNETGKNDHVFKIFDLKGLLLKKVNVDLSSKYNDPVYDTDMTLEKVDNQIHCLQKYGTSYLIYDENGNLLKRFELNRDPLKEKKYKKIKHKSAYYTFCVDENKIYASHAGKGEIILDVFDMDGHYLYSYRNPMNSNEIFMINDIKIVKKNNQKHIYLLLDQPDIFFIKASLD